MRTNICINDDVLQGISNFVSIDEKDNILNNIDRIIEINLKSGIAEEYQMSVEIGLLFDVKYLISKLPFKMPIDTMT